MTVVQPNGLRSYQITDLGLGQVRWRRAACSLPATRPFVVALPHFCAAALATAPHCSTPPPFARSLSLVLPPRPHPPDAKSPPPAACLGQVGISTGQAFASLEDLLIFFYDMPFPDAGNGHVPLTIMYVAAQGRPRRSPAGAPSRSQQRPPCHRTRRHQTLVGADEPQQPQPPAAAAYEDMATHVSGEKAGVVGGERHAKGCADAALGLAGTVPRLIGATAPGPVETAPGPVDTASGLVDNAPARTRPRLTSPLTAPLCLATVMLRPQAPPPVPDTPRPTQRCVALRCVTPSSCVAARCTPTVYSLLRPLGSPASAPLAHAEPGRTSSWPRAAQCTAR